MSSGRGRERSSQRVARSTERREESSISVWTSAATMPSSASISSHSARTPNTSRATIDARAMSAGDAPVSSRRRNTNVVPARSIRSLVTRVATISRRRRCRRITSPKRSGSGAGKYRSSSSSSAESSGRSDSSSAAYSVIFA